MASRTELALAGMLAVLVVVLDWMTNQPWQPTVLDLLACAAAAATAKWPRAAGIVLAGILVTYVFIPPPWATLGEYSLMIPILGTGIRGRRRIRTVMSIGYFLILAAISVADAPAGKSPVLGWIAWVALIAVLWVIGNVFCAMTEAQRKAREAELVLQRQALARALHDTVARSFSQIVMTAECARLHGSPDDAEWDRVAETARKANDELRLLMVLLRDPADTALPAGAPGTPLQDALAAAKAKLTELGFPASVVVDGPLDRLTAEQAAVMSEAVGEASANIVKHAEPGTACGIIVEVGENTAELAFVNRPRSPSAPTLQSVSMGLGNLRQSLWRVGGELFVDSSPEQWTTRASVPLDASTAPVAIGTPG